MTPRLYRDHDDHFGGGHTHDHGPPEQRPAGPVDPAQESLVGALRASFNVLRFLMIVLVLLYAYSGVLRVQPGEQALVARFGTLRERPSGGNVFEQGWYASLPDPFDTKYVLTGQILTLPVTTFMFAHPDAATSKNLAEIVQPKNELQPGVDGAMYTGDRNLSHGRWEVQYQISDAAAFVKNIASDPNMGRGLLTRLVETAVVREVAGRTVEEVTRGRLDDVRGGVKRRLQKSLDDLHSGVTVKDVVAYTIEPGAVRDAFMDVSRAESEKKTLEDQAKEKATETLNKSAGSSYPKLLEAIREYGAAQLQGANQTKLDELLGKIDAQLLEAEVGDGGQVAIRLRDARAEANATNEKLRSQYDEFTNYLKQRAARPAITMLGLWNDMRAAVIGDKDNEIFFVPASNIIEILVNRDPAIQKEREEEDILRRQGMPR